MRIRIRHTTSYIYDGEVFLEPQILRFRPKLTAWCRPESFTISIQPDPAGMSEFSDAEGNLNTMCWFQGMHREFTIQAESVVETREFNPYNFLIHPGEFARLPFRYKRSDLAALGPCLDPLPLDEKIIIYLEGILEESGEGTVDFIGGMVRNIQRDFRVRTREKGSPRPPARTFELRSGSCRDLSWMGIHMLRSAGIAARFVSGYYYHPDSRDEFELHAWLEAWLPGAGWIGADPSYGILTDRGHIPVSRSSHYENTMPVTGTVRGDSSPELFAEIEMEWLTGD